jgi:hypothetical protein
VIELLYLGMFSSFSLAAMIFVHMLLQLDRSAGIGKLCN